MFNNYAINMLTFHKKIWSIYLFFVIIVCTCLLSVSSPVYSQQSEPNNTCQAAQDLGKPELPFVVNDSLDSTPDNPDVDFFKFTGTPGSVMRIDLEGQDTNKGTLPDPFLGLFDSDCTLIRISDDAGSTLNSRLIFTVPANGTFVVAATQCCDDVFMGGGNGTYELTFANQTVAGSITGRIIDEITQKPLPGDDYPFTYVQLLRCTNGECFEPVNGGPTDSEGRFQFITDYEGNPLISGTYQVTAFADGYQSGQTMPFDIGEGENRDLGDIPLELFPIQISDIQPCENLPSEGGKCSYSVKLNNVLSEHIRGAAWSLVYSYGIGSPLDFTNFQAQELKKIHLKPEKSKVVTFSFYVPGKVKDGAFICAEVYVGQNLSSHKDVFFNTIGQSFLFCVTKGADNRFSVISQNDALKMIKKSERKKQNNTSGKSQILHKLMSSMPAK